MSKRRVISIMEAGARAEHLNESTSQIWEVDTFVRRWRAPVYRVCLMILGRSDSAEDAAQDALIRAVKEIKSGFRPANEWGWMRTIAIRRALTHLKKQKLWADLDEFHPGKPDPADERLAVDHALQRLRPMHRTMLGLAIGEGMTHAEIALALDIPEGTVASRLHQAKSAFRKIWEEEE